MNSWKGALALAAVGSLVIGALPARAWWPPKNTIRNTVAVLLTCGVDEASMTKNCSALPGVSSMQKAVLADVMVRPEYLPHAQSGTTVWTIIRRDPHAPDKPLPPAEIGPITPGPGVIEDSEWDVRPDLPELAGLTPDRAIRMGLWGGEATVICSVTADGQLVGCWVKSEAPPDFAFGEATLEMTTTVKLKTKTRSGVPVEGGVLILNGHFDIHDSDVTLKPKE